MKSVTATLVFVLAMATAPGGALAESEDAKQKPATRLESFSARSGVVVIKAFTRVGNVGDVTVQAMEFRDASNPKAREFGITLDADARGTRRMFVDYEEIDSLLRGIDYIARVQKDVTKFDDFEATYKTKGGLRVTAFTSEGKINALVDAGFAGHAFLNHEGLAELSGLIVKAKALIDAAKAK